MLILKKRGELTGLLEVFLNALGGAGYLRRLAQTSEVWTSKMIHMKLKPLNLSETTVSKKGERLEEHSNILFSLPLV